MTFHATWSGSIQLAPQRANAVWPKQMSSLETGGCIPAIPPTGEQTACTRALARVMFAKSDGVAAKLRATKL